MQYARSWNPSGDEIWRPSGPPLKANSMKRSAYETLNERCYVTKARLAVRPVERSCSIAERQEAADEDGGALSPRYFALDQPPGGDSWERDADDRKADFKLSVLRSPLRWAEREGIDRGRLVCPKLLKFLCGGLPGGRESSLRGQGPRVGDGDGVSDANNPAR